METKIILLEILLNIRTAFHTVAFSKYNIPQTCFRQTV